MAIYDEILTKGIRAGQVPAQTQKARDWYRDTAKTFSSASEASVHGKDRMTRRPVIGNMYFFNYKAKHAETLPYYDRFPLIFPVNKVKGGFYGINMHYLPLQLRAKLMDALYEVSNNKRFDESTKLKVSYQVLKSASDMEYFKPCFKRYLTSHVKSRFIYVYPSEFDIALFLPLESFQGANKRTVWKDSKKILGI